MTPLRGRLRVVAVLALFCALPPGRAGSASTQRAAPEEFAVIVHPSTRTGDVTLSQLRRIFRGEQQFWSDGDRVVLLIAPPGSRARAAVLRHLYRMEEGEFTRYWIAKIFRDAVPAGPKIVASVEMTKRLAARIPGAVAVIPASEVDASVAVLSVDRLLPGGAGYPLALPAP